MPNSIAINSTVCRWNEREMGSWRGMQCITTHRVAAPHAASCPQHSPKGLKVAVPEAEHPCAQGPPMVIEARLHPSIPSCGTGVRTLCPVSPLGPLSNKRRRLRQWRVGGVGNTQLATQNRKNACHRPSHCCKIRRPSPLHGSTVMHASDPRSRGWQFDGGAGGAQERLIAASKQVFCSRLPQNPRPKQSHGGVASPPARRTGARALHVAGRSTCKQLSDIIHDIS